MILTRILTITLVQFIYDVNCLCVLKVCIKMWKNCLFCVQWTVHSVDTFFFFKKMIRIFLPMLLLFLYMLCVKYFFTLSGEKILLSVAYNMIDLSLLYHRIDLLYALWSDGYFFHLPHLNTNFHWHAFIYRVYRHTFKCTWHWCFNEDIQ